MVQEKQKPAKMNQIGEIQTGRNELALIASFERFIFRGDKELYMVLRLFPVTTFFPMGLSNNNTKMQK